MMTNIKNKKIINVIKEVVKEKNNKKEKVSTKKDKFEPDPILDDSIIKH